MSAWVAWIKFLRGLRGLHGSKYFLRGSTFCVGHNFYVLRVSNIFLRGSNSFAYVFAWVIIFCVGQFLRTAAKNILIGAFKMIT